MMSEGPSGELITTSVSGSKASPTSSVSNPDASTADSHDLVDAPANAETQKIYDYALDKGLIFQIRGVRELKNVIRLVPPMTSTRAEVDQAMSVLYDAFSGLKKKGLKRKATVGKKR